MADSSSDLPRHALAEAQRQKDMTGAEGGDRLSRNQAVSRRTPRPNRSIGTHKGGAISGLCDLYARAAYFEWTVYALCAHILSA